MYYVHKYEVSLAYGGPEEGGWWYDTGEPCEGWIPIPFVTEDMAYSKCRELNAQEEERAKEEIYSYTSVLSYRSNHYAYSVTESSIPHAYPERRPHYE